MPALSDLLFLRMLDPMVSPVMPLCRLALRGVWLAGGLSLSLGLAQAQDAVYRCGNMYTNRPTDATGCARVTGGNVTVVQGPRSAARSPRVSASGGPTAGALVAAPRVSDAQQRQRDTDARAIIEAELQKTLARRDALRREFNNGQPEKTTDDARDPQRYTTRVAGLRDALTRADSDVAGLQRELTRLKPTGPGKP